MQTKTVKILEVVEKYKDIPECQNWLEVNRLIDRQGNLQPYVHSEHLQFFDKSVEYETQCLPVREFYSDDGNNKEYIIFDSSLQNYFDTCLDSEKERLKLEYENKLRCIKSDYKASRNKWITEVHNARNALYEHRKNQHNKDVSDAKQHFISLCIAFALGCGFMYSVMSGV